MKICFQADARTVRGVIIHGEPCGSAEDAVQSMLRARNAWLESTNAETDDTILHFTIFIAPRENGEVLYGRNNPRASAKKWEQLIPALAAQFH